MGHYLTNKIGNKIKTIRNQQGLSLQELSEKSNLSKGLLSKIENSRTVPSLPVFFKILECLDTAPKDFFEDMYFNDGKSFEVVRKEEQVLFQKEGRAGFIYKSIINQNILDLNIDIMHLTVEPNAQYEPTITDGYEFKLVLQGKIDYVIGEEIAQLNEGDAIFFDARLPHYPKASNEEVKIIVVYFLFAN